MHSQLTDALEHVARSLDKRQKRSRKRADEDEGDITWINEKNRQFNRKLQRYYDDVTRETRENFERGASPLFPLCARREEEEHELTLHPPGVRRNGALSEGLAGVLVRLCTFRPPVKQLCSLAQRGGEASDERAREDRASRGERAFAVSARPSR